MICLAKPDEDDIVAVLSRAIDMIRFNEISTISFHDQIKEMYSWNNVAMRTELVRNRPVGQPYHTRYTYTSLPMLIPVIVLGSLVIHALFPSLLLL